VRASLMIASGAIAGGAPHVSLYMLEVDEDSRLGNELLAGGARYHAHFVPQEELIADLYAEGCERLQAAGISQYEISNFARRGKESKHNLKYWTRQPYLGFGVDAHSMLRCATTNENKNIDAIRLAMPETLESFGASGEPMARFERTTVTKSQAWEERFFLGLRLNRGVNLKEIGREFGSELTERARNIARELTELGLAQIDEDALRLTARGRLLSNEVFEKFIGAEIGC